MPRGWKSAPAPHSLGHSSESEARIWACSVKGRLREIRHAPGSSGGRCSIHRGGGEDVVHRPSKIQFRPTKFRPSSGRRKFRPWTEFGRRGFRPWTESAPSGRSLKTELRPSIVRMEKIPSMDGVGRCEFRPWTMDGIGMDGIRTLDGILALWTELVPPKLRPNSVQFRPNSVQFLSNSIQFHPNAVQFHPIPSNSDKTRPWTM